MKPFVHSTLKEVQDNPPPTPPPGPNHTYTHKYSTVTLKFNNLQKAQISLQMLWFSNWNHCPWPAASINNPFILKNWAFDLCAPKDHGQYSTRQAGAPVLSTERALLKGIHGAVPLDSSHPCTSICCCFPLRITVCIPLRVNKLHKLQTWKRE